MDDRFLEPLNAYKTRYEAEYKIRSADLFDRLAARSGVDAGKNAKTVAAYEAEQRAKEREEARLGKYRSLKQVCVFFLAVGVILAIVAFFLLNGGASSGGGICLALGLVAAIASGAGLYELSRRKKNAEQIKAEHERKAQALYAEACREMAPLNALFDDGIPQSLFTQTVPEVQFDPAFGVGRERELTALGYLPPDPDDESRTTLFTLSGEVRGNPFLFLRERRFRMVNHTYSGSIVISWTTQSTDSQGNVRTESHSETLTAYVTRPRPRYDVTTELFYGCEAAPGLSFTHSPSHAEDLNEKQLRKKVKSGAKSLRKKQERAMSDPSSDYTKMTNDEFEVLFGATDRTDEVQFRLFFTPLAQKNMLALMRDPAGFGDDFSIRKRGTLTHVTSEHAASWDMDAAGERFRSHSFRLAREGFLSFNFQYFRSVFFDLAPLVSIPVYQERHTAEREESDFECTMSEIESFANRLVDRLEPADARTRVILKAERRGRGKAYIIARAFRTVSRTDYVSEYGGDGYYHDVPVQWTEYIPVLRVSTLSFKRLGLTRREFEERESFRSALSKHGEGGWCYENGVLCCVTDDESFDNDFSIE